MSQQQNKHNDDCKCIGEKRAKSLEKQIDELRVQLDKIAKELRTLRKAINQ